MTTIPDPWLLGLYFYLGPLCRLGCSIMHLTMRPTVAPYQYWKSVVSSYAAILTVCTCRCIAWGKPSKYCCFPVLCTNLKISSHKRHQAESWKSKIITRCCARFACLVWVRVWFQFHGLMVTVLWSSTRQGWDLALCLGAGTTCSD